MKLIHNLNYINGLLIKEFTLNQLQLLKHGIMIIWINHLLLLKLLSKDLRTKLTKALIPIINTSNNRFKELKY